MNDQPIVACATPRGEGAVSIVRISGSSVFHIADQCFKPVGVDLFSSAEERRLVYGKFYENDRVIDQCLAVRFIGPRSFSGEDMVEFQLHGNPLIVNSVIRVCVDLGCRLAEPGEFSRRAFLHGKMDLSQAEALAEVIRAESDAALTLAQRQLGGALSARFRQFREKIISSLALLELELDFVQEGYELVDYLELTSTLNELTEYCRSLLDIYRTGDRLRRGPRILLLGRPNAGKSSLFNAILGHSRALVSDIPGTTRDYLEERILYRGVVLHLLDTAGLRTTEDALEAEGVSRAQQLLPLADTVLYLIDSTLLHDEVSKEFLFIDSLRFNYPEALILPLFTKSDLVPIQSNHLSCSVNERPSIVSLLDLIVEQYYTPISDRLVLLSERQHHILRSMLTLLEGVDVDSSIPAEFLSADLRQLLTPISQLTGEVTNEDILDSVFSGFCIGK